MKSTPLDDHGFLTLARSDFGRFSSDHAKRLITTRPRRRGRFHGGRRAAAALPSSDARPIGDVGDVGDFLFSFTRAFLVILGEWRITDFTDFTYRTSRDAAVRRSCRDSSCLA
jgi:hypothetical protein